MGRPKLTQELVDRTIALKRDGLSNGDIVCALRANGRSGNNDRWAGNEHTAEERCWAT